MDLIKELESPTFGSTKKEFQKHCLEMAKELFRDYCIDCNGKEYYFAEVEFYYWQKGEDNKWNEKWNRVTYPRICKAKNLFFHLSGMDICFESNYKDSNAKSGGILVRALADEHNNIIVGPWICMLEMLNLCQGKNMPVFRKKENKREWHPVVLPAKRSLGKTAMKENLDEELNLCFYDSSIPEKKWKEQKTISINKKTGEINIGSSSYNLNRFELS